MVTLASVFLWWRSGKQDKEAVLEEKKVEIPIDEPIENKNETVEEKKDIPMVEEKTDEAVEKKLPDKILIDVPFSSQAPLGKWDAYHEESCEETSIIMEKYYLDRKKLTPEIAEKEIQAMIAYEKKNYGHFEDSNAQEVVELAHDFYGMDNLKAIYDFSKDDLKRYLSLGKPIIVPAAGRRLGNPNFTAPGPIYHNLVLTGYDGNVIITNDPGTRKGQGYRYNIDVLYDAIHDFPGNLKDMEKGRKAMIIME
jgi:hypothetical protein